MGAINFLTFYFLIFNFVFGQDEVTEQVHRLIKVCDYCTCSEIPDVDGTHLVLNIQCSELDKIGNLADLDKIQWPPNSNGLKIAAAFEGLGLTTLGKDSRGNTFYKDVGQVYWTRSAKLKFCVKSLDGWSDLILMKLWRLPPNPQVETLRFSNNAIKTYWPDPFSDVQNLKKLSFSQNELTEITPDLFTKIAGLEDLDLSYNKITDISPLDFKFLHHVKRLNLQSNLMKKVPVEALQPMIMLEDLDLSKNGIFDVMLRRVETESMKKLTRLNLSGNRIRSIRKESFPENNNIELLDLSNNIIEVVEEDALLSCINLRELNLAQNNITFTFALPQTLQIAILKINTLYHWPKFPSSITYIDLSYNRLSGLYNENNVDFNNLEVLSIGGNQIKDFHIENKLPKLFSLDISYNLISDVPKCLSSQIFPNLEELRLDGNPIETIYFKNILALKTLYMNDLNKLRVVEDKAFSNVIGRTSELMSGEKYCFTLFLSNCASLHTIQEGAFDGTSLCMLDISKNNLTALSKTLLDWSTLSEGANLQFNPWHCSCELQWLLDDLLPQMYRANSRLLAELRCGSPRAYEGLRLVHWYNWTEQAMCNDDYMRGGPQGTYVIQTMDSGPKVTTLTLILVGCILVALLIAISLFVYLVKSRRRHRIRQAALNRKRQSTSDEKNSNGLQREQFTALNKT